MQKIIVVLFMVCLGALGCGEAEPLDPELKTTEWLASEDHRPKVLAALMEDQAFIAAVANALKGDAEFVAATNGSQGGVGGEGPEGPEGPQGPQGPQGPKGGDGASGEDGKPGISCTDADPEWETAQDCVDGIAASVLGAQSSLFSVGSVASESGTIKVGVEEKLLESVGKVCGHHAFILMVQQIGVDGKNLVRIFMGANIASGNGIRSTQLAHLQDNYDGVLPKGSVEMVDVPPSDEFGQDDVVISIEGAGVPTDVHYQLLRIGGPIPGNTCGYGAGD